MKNNNGAVIRRLTGRSLKSNKKRNFFIITAIALTTLLMASVFSIGMSLMESMKMQETRLTNESRKAAAAPIGIPNIQSRTIWPMTTRLICFGVVPSVLSKPSVLLRRKMRTALFINQLLLSD